MRPQLSADFELIIPISPTLTYYRMMINRPVALVDIHLQSVIYYWTVLIYKMSGKDTSEICLKLLTIVLLLILSKTSIAYYSISVRFS